MPSKVQSRTENCETDGKDAILLRLSKDEAEEVLKLIAEIRRRR